MNRLRSVHWLFCSPSDTQSSCKSVDHLIHVWPTFLTRTVDQNLFCETLHHPVFTLHKQVPDWASKIQESLQEMCCVLTCYKITSLNCWVENYWSSLRLNTKKAHISHSLISLLFKDLLHFAPGLQKYQCGAVCILTFLSTGMYAQPEIN